MRFAPRWLYAALVVTTVACNDKDDKNGGASVCDAKKTVDCGSVPAADVGGAHFVAGLGTATCSSDGSAWDTSACTAIAGGAELALCTGSGQGDCDSGLTCVATGIKQSQCLPACDANDGCADNYVCVRWNQDTGEKYCFELTTTGDQCFADAQCSTTGDTCQYTAAEDLEHIYGGCSRECTGGQVGKAGGAEGNNCKAEETCVSNPLFFDYQKNGSNEVGCDPTATTDTCDIANGYRCQSDAPSQGQSSCVRFSGLCVSHVRPLLATSPDINASLNAIDAGTYDSLCFVPAGGNKDGYLGQILVGGYGCGLTAVTGPPADVACARYPLPTDDDVTTFGYCVGFCEGPNGTTLDCGSDYHCGRPDVKDALYIDPQQNAGAEVSCTGADDVTSCDSSGGYTCVTVVGGNKVCARPRLLCLKN